MNYIDLGLEREERVTFEADNNSDFRLGTGAFRYTKKAKEKDLALITRLSEYDYEIRIVPTEDKKYPQLLAYATSYIGTSNPQLVDFKQVKSSGDAFLIATAMKYGLTVITEENKTGQKKIPFVCNSLGVPCVDILGLCEKEGWSF